MATENRLEPASRPLSQCQEHGKLPAPPGRDLPVRGTSRNKPGMTTVSDYRPFDDAGVPRAIQSHQVGKLPPTIEWSGGRDGTLRLLDQTLLPEQVAVRECRSAADVCDAIRRLQVRGAPAIGVAAALGLCLELSRSAASGGVGDAGAWGRVGALLSAARPTAVNLSWAVKRVLCAIERAARATPRADALALWNAGFAEAVAILAEDVETCRRIGEHGAALVPEGGGVLTHCNAGALATAGCGTALALLYVARERGRRFQVYADETRPLLQGARLTAFELAAAGIDVTVVCDGVAAALMGTRKIDMVVVGADRIAANGDTANKIGTYGLAIAARHHGVPFYVAAPRSTFDRGLSSGAEIPIETRSEEELRHAGSRVVVARGAGVFNPAFDVTPAGMITGLVTEKGLLQPVTTGEIAKIFG
ncbi:MAG: Methylthioribose-1-phosphate isomerase [Phycisphaerae bacterium]|nr:Methylthioribose-1-phosphate isomerase [Phycisphaerae bacterium]